MSRAPPRPNPAALAVAADGSVYIAPTLGYGCGPNPSVRHVSPTGVLLDSWVLRDLNGDCPSALAVALDGSIYLAAARSYSVVYHFTPKGTLIGRPWSTFGQVRPETFDASGIALDAARDVYVIDTWHNRSRAEHGSPRNSGCSRRDGVRSRDRQEPPSEVRSPSVRIGTLRPPISPWLG
jgi:hypothetical protein